MATPIRAPTNPPDLDHFTRLVGRVLEAPVACISLIDEDGRLSTSSFGLPPPNAMLVSWLFLKQAGTSGRPLVIADGRRDPRGARIPAVCDGTVAAYLGMPIVTSDGRVVGTLAVMDRRPRRWRARDVGFLRKVGARLLAERDPRTAARGVSGGREVDRECVPLPSERPEVRLRTGSCRR